MIVNKLKRNEGGQGLVEFVLVLPILLLLVLGMIEYGWLLNGKISLNSAAREGARVGAVLINISDEDRKERVLDTVNSALGSSGIETIDATDLEVREENNDPNNIHDIVVVVNGEIRPIIGLYVPDLVQIKSEARMRRG